MADALEHHHRDTLAKIFAHPTSANVEWREVHSLLEAVGTVTEEHNGKVKISVAGRTEVLRPPRGKDVDVTTIVELRKLLTDAGLTP